MCLKKVRKEALEDIEIFIWFKKKKSYELD